MDRNGFIYFNTRLSLENSGKADSHAWAIMILDEVLPYQDVTDLKENGNQPAEFNVNLITAAVLLMMHENPSATQKEIATAIGKSERTVKTVTVALQEKLIVKRVNGKRNGYWEFIE